VVPPRRIDAAFARARGHTGLIPYLTAGFPTLDDSLALMLAFAAADVRAIEVGVPFSDPIADGPEIQRSSEHALRAGVGLVDVLRLVSAFRARHDTPVVVMTYANPVVRHGASRFARESAEAGVDGVIVSDLPPDEDAETWAALDDAGLDTIALVAPTTSSARLPQILERCRGFVYCLSRTGVTGRSAGESAGLDERLAEVRAHTTLPLAVGFGISGPSDAAALRGRVDAIVVGAAFMRAIAEAPPGEAVARAGGLAHALTGALA
jgi:tryptophan synthase alpha chain